MKKWSKLKVGKFYRIFMFYNGHPQSVNNNGKIAKLTKKDSKNYELVFTYPNNTTLELSWSGIHRGKDFKYDQSHEFELVSRQEALAEAV